jgi:ABC-2 type transport system ATP-binding protein
MWDFLREINRRGTTIILTTHYLEEAESLCRSIAIIDRGLIIEDTKMKALLNKLHVETFVLDLRTAVHEPPHLPGYGVRWLDATTLEVDVSRDQNINRLFAELSDLGIEVLSLRNKANRLEELFLRLTGSGAPERAPTPEAPPEEVPVDTVQP